MFNELEALAADLKSLVGYGAKPQHVLIRPALRDCVMNKHPGLTNGALSQAILHELNQAVDSFPDAEAEAYRLLLNLDGLEWSATTRRLEAIVRLRLWCSVEKFRRPEGPEMDLMRQLAKALM